MDDEAAVRGASSEADVEAEVNAAVAELESLGPPPETGPADGIPDPSAHPPEEVIAIPVPASVSPPARAEPGADGDTSAEPAPAEVASAPDDPRAVPAAGPTDAGEPALPRLTLRQLLAELLRRLLRRGRRAEAAPAAPATPEAQPAGGAARMNILLRGLDLVLDLVNRPFAFLSPGARQMLGIVSVTTLIISVSAGVALPRILPRRDALSFLQEKRAELLLGPAAATSKTPTTQPASPPG